jgi:nitrate reductase gamma subunit
MANEAENMDIVLVSQWGVAYLAAAHAHCIRRNVSMYRCEGLSMTHDLLSYFVVMIATHSS